MDLHGSRDHGDAPGRPSALSRRKFLGTAGSAVALSTALGASTASASTQSSRSPGRALPQISVPGAGLVGATVLPGGPDRGADATAFDAIVGRPLGEAIQKIYYGRSEFPTSDPDIANLKKVGCQVILCYKPQPGGADIDALGTSLGKLKNYGNVHGVVLWQEVQYDFANISAFQYISEVQVEYGPAIRNTYNLPLYYDASPNPDPNVNTDGFGGVKSYFPGNDYIDVAACDLYANQYWDDSFTLDEIQALAGSSTPVGIFEFGVTNKSTQPQSPIQVAAFYDYVLSTMSARLAKGLTNGPICYFDGGATDNITSSNDYRVTTLQAIYDTLSKNSTVTTP
jgi:hypothetical protein